MRGDKMEYLFVDIEWNQKEGTTDISGREPIQIGAIGTGKNLEIEKSFSKGIRVKYAETITEKTCKIVHTNVANIMQGNTEEVVFDNVIKTFETFKYVVVWTKDTYDLFCESMERSGVKMPRHRVIIVQDVLNQVLVKKSDNIGFERALIMANIPYQQNFLHLSKHDVKYLYKLFKKTYEYYKSYTAMEEGIVNKNTRIIHNKGCGHVRFEDMSEDEIRKHPLTDEYIRWVCSRFGLKYNISYNVIFISSHVGHWRVYLAGNKVENVFHGNYIESVNTYKKKKKCNEGFHKQDVDYDNFYDVVRYIYYHDKNQYVKKHPKSRIEILFEQIEKEKLKNDNIF